MGLPDNQSNEGKFANTSQFYLCSWKIAKTSKSSSRCKSLLLPLLLLLLLLLRLRCATERASPDEKKASAVEKTTIPP